MKTKFLVPLLLVLLLRPAFAAGEGLDPLKTIEADGSITLTDGSSYYTFSKGGGFISGPVGLGRKNGRVLEGSWTLSGKTPSAELFTVTASWSWSDAFPRDDDYRRIVFQIGPGEKRPFRDHMVPAITEFAAYLLIDEFVKIPKPAVLPGAVSAAAK